MLEIKKPQVTNPYIAGKALNQDRGFFGREDIFELVANEMLSPDRNAVVMFGQRRIGKTSILLQLQRRLPGELFIPIYFDLMDHAASPLGRLLHDLAAAMAASVSMPVPDASDFDDQGVFFRERVLPQFYAAAGPDRRPVLLFDEFDVLGVADERQLAATVSGRSFFPYVRRLMEGEPRLGFVFVAGRKAEELSMDVKAAFKTARYKRVSVLDRDSAEALVRVAEQQRTLSYEPAAVDRILKLTAGHPYFTQLVCQLLFDEMYRRPGPRPPKAELSHVDAVVLKAPEAGENICEWIWDGLPPAEKVIYAAIAQATETRPFVSAPEIMEVLQRNGVRFLTRELEVAPETLVKWEMLEEKDGKYGFFIELMRRWVAARKPLPKVKDELDRLVPLADSLFQSGDGFYRRGNLDNSQNLLQQALAVNPNHLKARLLLAQVLVEQGKLEEAVRELEEARRYDTVAAQYPLIRTLLLREEELERANDMDGALTACERVLEIAPGNNVATERRATIWRQRGEKALSADQLDEASAAFEKIKAADMLEKVALRRRRLEIDNLAKQAQNHFDQERWDQSADVYKQLAVLEPAEKNWREAVERCGTEQRISKLYADGIQALQSEQWRKAQALFIEILRTRPEYKETGDLLVQALKPAPPALPGREPVVVPFLRVYAKCAIAVGVCIAGGLLNIRSGNGDLAASTGFYLGTAVSLCAVLLLLHFAERSWNNLKNTP
jgi:tetratricopeptide (TPR) repeat protein